MKKTIRHIMLPAIFIASALIFTACSSTKYGEKVVTVKKWVNWEVDFKDNASDEEKIKVLHLADKNILDSLYALTSPSLKILYVTISHIPLRNPPNTKLGSNNNSVVGNSVIISVQVGVGGVKTTGISSSLVVPIPHPHCCPPPIMPGVGSVKGVREIE